MSHNYSSRGGRHRPATARLSLWTLVAALLVIGEYVGTQSMFWISPATETIYGDRFADLAAFAGYGVTVSMVLLSVVGRGWLTLRVAMWLYAAMAAGFLMLSRLPAWPVALAILTVIGLVAVQISYVKAAAPALAGGGEEEEYIQTRIETWVQSLQPFVIVGLLLVAQRFGVDVACLTIAAMMIGVWFLGLRYAKRVRGAGQGAAASPASRTWDRRVIRAALLNLIDVGRIGALLMILTAILPTKGFQSALWAGGVSLTTGVLVGLLLKAAEGRLKRTPPAKRVRGAALIGLLAAPLLAGADLTSGAAFLVPFGLALVVVGFATSVFGAGVQEKTDGKSWTGSQFLVLNAARALGFTVSGHASATLMANKLELGGMRLSYVHVFAVFAVLVCAVTLRRLPARVATPRPTAPARWVTVAVVIAAALAIVLGATILAIAYTNAPRTVARWMDGDAREPACGASAAATVSSQR